jgi:glycosyltransferase involved in cell wall biosynthesis
VTAVAEPATLAEPAPPLSSAADGARPLRIAFVYDALYPYVLGGGERRFHELARRLAERHEIHFVSWRYWDGAARIERDGMTFHGVAPAPELYGGDGKRTVREAVAFAWRALPVLLRERFDVVDCSATPYLPLYAAALATRLRGTPMVATWHEFWGEHWEAYLPHRRGVARAARLLESLRARQGDHVVPVSPVTARRIGSRAPRQQVVPNGVDLDEIRRAPADPLSSDLLFVGRLIDDKRVDLLLGAVGRLVKRWPQLRCTVVGEGPQRADLEARVAELGVTANVRFTGWVDPSSRVFGLMKAARLLVMPSVREGFGISVVEGQACGAVPVVVRSPMSAAPDLIRDGIDGRLCDASVESLAETLTELLASPQRLEAMSSAAIEAAEAWSWDRLADEMEAIYRRLAAPSSVAVPAR